MACKITLLVIVLALAALIELSSTTHMDLVNDSNDFQRSKRSLTTICVEIKPSGPKQEPYFMCKGADLQPTFQHGSNSNTNFDNQQFPGSNEHTQPANPTNTPTSYAEGNNHGTTSVGGGSNFRGPTKSYDAKSQITNHSNAPPISPNDAFQQPTIPNKHFNSGKTQSFLPQQSTFQSTKASSYPSYEAPTQNYNQPQIHNQFQEYTQPAYFAEEQPPSQPSQTQPAAGFGIPSSATSATSKSTTTNAPTQPPRAYTSNNANAYETPTAYNAAYGRAAQTATAAGEPVLSQSNTNSNDGMGFRTYASPASDTVGAAVTQTTYPIQTISDALAAFTPAQALQSSARTTSTAAAVARMVPAIAKSTTSALLNPNAETSRFRGNSGTIQQQRPRYQSYDNMRQNFSPPRRQQQPQQNYNPYNPSARHRGLLDGQLLGAPPNFDFSREQYDDGDSDTENDPFIGYVASIPPQFSLDIQQFQQPRTVMPPEYMNDPVMQQFYASLQEPSPIVPRQRAMPAPPVDAANAEPLLSSDYDTPHSAQKSQRPIYKKPPINTNAACPIYTPPSTIPCVPCTSYAPSQTSPQYAVAPNGGYSYASPPAALSNSDCNACNGREYNYQPVFIALPCYGAQPPTYSGSNTLFNNGLFGKATNTPITSPTYENVANARSMPNLVHPPLVGFPHLGFGNPLTRLFFNPLGFGGVGLLGASPGLPPSTGNLFAPNADFGAMNPFANLFNWVQPPIAQQTIIPENREANSSNESQELKTISSTTTTTTTTTENPNKQDIYQNAGESSFEESQEDFKKSKELNDDKFIVGSSAPEIIQRESTTEAVKIYLNSGERLLNKNKDEMVAYGADAKLIDEEMPNDNWEEATQKTFKTLLTAAKTLATIAKEDEELTDEEQKNAARKDKRQNVKASTGNVNYRRKYVQKL